jgi:hypothetical protein
VYGREQEHVKRLVVVADEAPGLTRGKTGAAGIGEWVASNYHAHLSKVNRIEHDVKPSSE